MNELTKWLYSHPTAQEVLASTLDGIPECALAGARTMHALGAPDARLVRASESGTMWTLHNWYFVLHPNGEPLDGVEATRASITQARAEWGREHDEEETLPLWAASQ